MSDSVHESPKTNVNFTSTKSSQFYTPIITLLNYFVKEIKYLETLLYTVIKNLKQSSRTKSTKMSLQDIEALDAIGPQEILPEHMVSIAKDSHWGDKAEKYNKSCKRFKTYEQSIESNNYAYQSHNHSLKEINRLIDFFNTDKNNQITYHNISNHIIRGTVEEIWNKLYNQYSIATRAYAQLFDKKNSYLIPEELNNFPNLPGNSAQESLSIAQDELNKYIESIIKTYIGDLPEIRNLKKDITFSVFTEEILPKFQKQYLQKIQQSKEKIKELKEEKRIERQKSEALLRYIRNSIKLQ